MRHYPPDEFGPPSSPETVRPFSFVEWVIIVLVAIASVSVTLAVIIGRVP